MEKYALDRNTGEVIMKFTPHTTDLSIRLWLRQHGYLLYAVERNAFDDIVYVTER